MDRMNLKRIVTLALVLVGLVAFTAALAKPKKLPAHPTKLKYGKLEFEVPDASDYRHELSNGIPVYIGVDHALPLVDVSITLRAGSFLDPESKRGLASMTGRMLRRGGTKSMTAQEFDERADFLAANIRSNTGDLSGGASLDCITPVLDESLELFFEMLKAPRFEEERLQVEKDNLLEDMKQRNDNPADIARREWQWLMRGHDHFTGHVMTKGDLDGLSREDLAGFHGRYWRPDLMIISVSGDVEPDRILANLERHFSDWKVDGPEVPWPPPAPSQSPKAGVYRVEKDIPQGRVRIGHLGAQRKDWNDPDAYAIAVMNDILGGGGFTSRLTKRIRSDEGLAYSTGSSFRVGQYWPGTFNVYYQSKSATVAFAAEIAQVEIDRIRETPVSEDELNVAKGSFIDVFPRRFESAGQVAATFADDEYFGRPHDYWNTYRERIRAVGAKDVQRVAEKYLHPDRLVYLVVGKWEDIEPGDEDDRASMKQFHGGESTQLPLRDPLTLVPMK